MLSLRNPKWSRGELNRAGEEGVGAGSKCCRDWGLIEVPFYTPFSGRSVPGGQDNVDVPIS
jgi:hypothetical protein